ncbi:hypothetical protein EMCRGX_G008375 [Ephydatia muelleri]
MVRKFRNQSYAALKRRCMSRRELFTDPEFPPTAQSLFFSGRDDNDVVWKRPKDIAEHPHLVVNGVKPTDMNQGQLGNCWFVAACASIATEPRLWGQVVPNYRDQDWDDAHPERYAGIFHFHFWCLGEWVDVVVDDLLPTKDGELVYTRSKDKNEFWGALMEKAFAKLVSCYEALESGQTGDALAAFTGGVNEYFDLKAGGYHSDEQKMVELFETLEERHRNHSLISCSIAKDDPGSDGVLSCGLVQGHAYCVLDVRKVPLHSGIAALFRKEKLMMVKLMNPWGHKEWNGPWSDGSEEWNRIPKAERERLGISIQDDGEFWMEVKDWCSIFTQASVCYLVNTRVLTLQKTWHEAAFHGRWTQTTSGGCLNHRDTFLTNPQYILDVSTESEVLINLIQKDPRDERTGAQAQSIAAAAAASAATPTDGAAPPSKDGQNYSIGCDVFKVEENRQYRLHYIPQHVSAITHTNRVSIFGRMTLKPGRYAVVPSTFEPGFQRAFYMRMYTEHANRARVLKYDGPRRGCLGFLCCCCVGLPQAVVTVKLECATELAKQDMIGKGADPYCLVTVGNTRALTPVQRDTLEPKFNSSLLFYVKNPQTAEIKIEVWNKNPVVDGFMGQVTMPLPRDGAREEHHVMKLMDRGRHNDRETQGSIVFEVTNSRDLRSV